MLLAGALPGDSGEHLSVAGAALPFGAAAVTMAVQAMGGTVVVMEHFDAEESLGLSSGTG